MGVTVNAVKRQYKLAGYANYSGNQSVGFALPLFSQEGSTALYLQCPDVHSKTIDSFLLAEDQPRHHKTTVALTASVGEPLVYVFLETDGKIYAGPLASITLKLNTFAKNAAHHPEILMQIADLIGTKAERFNARKSFMGTLKSLAPNSQASRSFVISDIRNWVWQRLLDKEQIRTLKPGIFKRLKSVQVGLTEEFRVKISLLNDGAWSKELIDELAVQASADYKSLLVELGEIEKIGQQQSIPNENFLTTLFVDFNNGGSQTLRLAIFLESIFKNPEFSQPIVRHITKDRAKLTNDAVLRIYHVVTQTGFTGTDFDKQRLLAVAWSALSRGMSGLKADFLYYLSQRLGDDRVVNRFIYGKLAASSSYVFENLARHLKEIGFKPMV